MIKQLDHFRIIIPNPEGAKSLVLLNAYYNKLQLNKINHKFEGVCLFKTLTKVGKGHNYSVLFVSSMVTFWSRYFVNAKIIDT